VEFRFSVQACGPHSHGLFLLQVGCVSLAFDVEAGTQGKLPGLFLLINRGYSRRCKPTIQLVLPFLHHDKKAELTNSHRAPQGTYSDDPL